MTKKVIIILALLLATVQGAWAVWDGVTTSRPTLYPSYGGRSDVVVINTAAELAYVREHWDDDYTGYIGYPYMYYYQHNFYLNADIDMGDKKSYVPLGTTEYEGTFYGNGHTIRIHIWGTSDNYQGLFSAIGVEGRVQDVHVAGEIACENSRLVGGICGYSRGYIGNCWVSADVSSKWHESASAYSAKVGGICGELYARIVHDMIDNIKPAGKGRMEYCGMSGNVTNNDACVGGLVGYNHTSTIRGGVFYGRVISDHTQYNIYEGSSDGEASNLHQDYPGTRAETWAMYGHILNPYTVNISNEGPGVVEASYEGTYPGATITLTPKGATVQSVTATDADGNNIAVSSNGTGGYTFSMPRRDVKVKAVFSSGSWPQQGEGTETSPYVINSLDDWAEFAYLVSSGSNDFSGKFIRLDADISVTTMAGAYTSGTEHHPFSGTFDGDGHTLNINVSKQSRFAAPFKCVNGATIKDLHVTGIIDGAGNLDGKLLGGIVGVSYGETSLLNCRCSATINTDYGNDANLYGLVAAMMEGSINVEGCLFDGALTGYDNTHCAGLVGYPYSDGSYTITNSVFAPTTLTVKMSDEGYAKTIAREVSNTTVTINNCYYTQLLGDAQGKQAYTVTAGDYVTVAGAGTVSKEYAVSGLTFYTGGGMKYADVIYASPDEAVSLELGKNRAGYTLTSYQPSAGTLTGTANPYVLTMPSDNVTIGATFTINTLPTDASGRYTIGSADDWDAFCAQVEIGNDFSGKVVTLTTDISVGKKCGVVEGSSPQNAFSGTFLGNGHTITATITDDNNQGTALFSYINNAAIKELTVAGTIASNQWYIAGLVGFFAGTSSIEGCTVTATLNINTNKSGGIVGYGMMSAIPSLKDCVFAGIMNALGGNNPNIGVLWGGSDDNGHGAPKLQNCLEAGTYNSISKMHPIGLGMYDGSLTDCYYVTPKMGTPSFSCTLSGSTKVLAAVPDNEICKKLTVNTTTVYRQPCTVSGVSNSYEYTGNDIAVVPTVAADDGTPLTAGTDYTVAVSPATVKDRGQYTVTITAQGNYSGTKTMTFSVGNYTPITSSSTTLASGNYMVYNDVTISDRIVIDGDVVLYLGQGTTLTASKGIELANGKSLVIEGSGALVVNNCADGKSGIGAQSVGALTVKGGQLTIAGGANAAGIGPDADANTNSGTLTLGWTNLEDFVDVSTYANQTGSTLSSITFVEGQQFCLDGTKTTANAGNIGGKKIVPLVVTGTEDDPYIISSTDDWDNFVAAVSSGTDYSGKFVKLAADISVARSCGTVAGSEQRNAFCGTFDGDGHTITADITDTGNQGTALFSYVKNATIKHLTVAGSITGGMHAAAIMGFADGVTSIEGCTATAAISGGTHIGGLLGHALDGDITVNGCVFSGTLTGGSTAKGVFVGWGNDEGSRSVTDCLYLMPDGQDLTGLDLARMHGGNVTLTDCYKTTETGTYGTLVSATASADQINKSVTAADGKTYYQACTVSGVYNLYKYTGDVITIVPVVTAADGTTLTTDADYTVAVSPATVQDKGDYTLTVSGKGDYVGTATFSFVVTDECAVTSELMTLEGGITYKVTKDVTVLERITVKGDAVLWLGAGATLTAHGGIELSGGNSLVIDGPGALLIDKCASSKSGIGAYRVGRLTIKDGTITVTGGTYGAALGGDRHNCAGGSITINGGTVTATGGDKAAAIGGGYDDWSGNYGLCGDITINGGQVTATGSNSAPGIGPGCENGEQQHYGSGSLTLGWTSPTDFISNSGFTNDMGSTLNSITFADGKAFVLDGTATLATADNIAGQKIVPVLTLTDRDDNSTTLETYDSETMAVVLDGRTLYKDGDWNTLCLPFDVTISGSVLDGAVVKTLSSSDYDSETGTLTLNFTEESLTEIEAGKPYIVKWNGDGTQNIVSPIFEGVTISSTAATETDGSDWVDFVGTYSPTVIYEEGGEKHNLYLGSSNKLYYPTREDFMVNACRTYFRLKNGLTAGEPSAPQQALARAFVLNFGDGEPSAISTLRADTAPAADGTYTLDGRRLTGKPTAKGLYIVNGKKIIIK